MTDLGTASALLVISAPVAMEDSIVDWLLGQPQRIGFSSGHIRGHGSKEGRLSIAEQVAGHQHRVQFQILAPLDTIREATAGLRRDFAGSDLFYWVAPVLESGHVTPQRPGPGR